jgi:hypothetical protein
MRAKHALALPGPPPGDGSDPPFQPLPHHIYPAAALPLDHHGSIDAAYQRFEIVLIHGSRQ